MASPFRVFRKYQKSLLAVAGVALMLVFVIGDPLSQYLRPEPTGQSKRRPTDVAVSWKGGKLTNLELQNLVTRRAIVNNFLRTVEYVGRMTIREAGGEPQLRVQMVVGPERPQDGVESDVVRMQILAQAARKAGMYISDDYIMHYLQQLGYDRVGPDKFREILASMKVQGHAASADYIFEGVRDQLLAHNYLSSYTFALDTILPEQRWQDWLNVNDRVVVEAAALPVDSYVMDVPEPTEAELQTYFDRYRKDEPRPDFLGDMELPSASPGFAVPRKLEVQYLKAEYDKLLAKAETEVKDEEIKDFYEKNKDPYFIKAGSILSDTPATKTDATDSKPATNAKPEDKKDEKAGPNPKQGSSDDSAKQSVFQLTAFQQDAKSGNAPAAAPTQTAPTEIGAAPTAEKPKEFQPLDEVKDEIRREIAKLKVNDDLEKLVDEVERELSTKYNNYMGGVLDAEVSHKEPPKPPADLADLQPLAEKYGLEYKKTEPLSPLQLRDSEIGRSASGDEGNIPLLSVIFSKSTQPYQPISTFDIDNNRYITMKISDTPGRVPELSEVRDEVVKAWKRNKAAEIALKSAEEKAKKAQESGDSLADYFANDKEVKVTKTDPFAMLTIGNISRQTQQVQNFRLSQPDGIDAAGPLFMQKVFSLGDKDVGAVLNHDHSIAYVVRIAEHQNTPEELHQQFLPEADNWYGVQALSRDRAQLASRVLISDTLQAADLDWKRPPDQLVHDDEQ